MKKITLSNGMQAAVDDADFAALSQFSWYAHRSPTRKDGVTVVYAFRQSAPVDGVRSKVYMHREITKATPDKQVDHEDGDGLNNQRSNLRLCNQSQNLHASKFTATGASGFKGVYRYKQRPRKPYEARIYLNGKGEFLGLFATAEAAARAYDSAAIRVYGEFARLNFPRRQLLLQEVA